MGGSSIFVTLCTRSFHRAYQLFDRPYFISGFFRVTLTSGCVHYDPCTYGARKNGQNQPKWQSVLKNSHFVGPVVSYCLYIFVGSDWENVCSPLGLPSGSFSFASKKL
jgi:hypothetical protein